MLLDEATAPEPTELAELRRRLLHAVRRHCPPSLRDEADDLTQVAMLKVLAARRGEGDGPRPSSYLWRTAYSVVIDEIRQRSRRQEVALPDLGPHDLRDPAPGPEQDAAFRRLQSALTDCLQRLVEDRRRAIVLRLQGHAVVEVARLLGWPAKTADNLVYRGLADLRRCLRRKGVER